jgi:hypothetical protein
VLPGLLPAIIGAASLVVGAILTWLFGFSSRRHDYNQRSYMDQQMTELRFTLDRALKSHDANMRLRSDARLRILERMLTDVGQYRTKSNAAMAALERFVTEAVPSGQTERAKGLFAECQEAFRAVPQAGPFVPPDVLDPATILFGELQEAMRDAAAWSVLPDRGDREARCAKMANALEATGQRYRGLFGGWLMAQYQKHDLLAGVEMVTTPAPPVPASESLRARPAKP